MASCCKIELSFTPSNAYNMAVIFAYLGWCVSLLDAQRYSTKVVMATVGVTSSLAKEDLGDWYAGSVGSGFRDAYACR